MPVATGGSQRTHLLRLGAAMPLGEQRTGSVPFCHRGRPRDLSTSSRPRQAGRPSAECFDEPSPRHLRGCTGPALGRAIFADAASASLSSARLALPLLDEPRDSAAIVSAAWRLDGYGGITAGRAPWGEECHATGTGSHAARGGAQECRPSRRPRPPRGRSRGTRDTCLRDRALPRSGSVRAARPSR